MFFMCYYWSRTSPGRGGWTKIWRNSRPAATRRNIRWKRFKTVQSIQKSQQRVTYQASITWCHGRVTLRKKTPGSLHWQYNTSESCSAPFTKIILTSQRQPPPPLTLRLQWLDLQCLNLQYLGSLESLLRLPNKNAVDQQLPVLRTRRQRYSNLPRLQIGFPPQ